MKISFNWLKSYVPITCDVLSISGLLTRSGLEVSNIYPTIKGGLEGLVIGEVIACTQHPNADRLKQTLVDIGGSAPLSIVCGAPNVAVGQKVVVAPVGTILYGYPDQLPFQIKKAKIRGILSEGMICAEDEIGVGSEHEGILLLDTELPIGTPAKECFKAELDEVLEIEITPNRGDACSHIGVARELKALLQLPITLPKVDSLVFSDFPCSVQIEAMDAASCPRYCGIVLKNVSIQPSPKWLRIKLAAIGLKSINNVVDTTNFVLHELGQPLHAFDCDAIQGQNLFIKHLPAGSSFLGLDRITRTLTGQELMICDAKGPIAMAGILGGLDSKITDNTQNIFLESAYFNAAVIRKAAQIHGLRTDASFRFERGLDPHITCYALKRAVSLLQEFLPGLVASQMIECYPTPIAWRTIGLTYKKVNQLLGTVIESMVIKQIMYGLEITIEEETEEGFIAKIPPYRVDVATEVDLIEEIARIYGYDSIALPEKLSANYLSPGNHIDQAYKKEELVSKILVAHGCHEIWTNSLTKSDYFASSSQVASIATCAEASSKEFISIMNPLSSHTNALRSSLLFSGLEVIAGNMAHHQTHFKFFEFGNIYYQDRTGYNQERRLSIWLTGQIEPTNWIRKLGFVSLFNLRHLIDQIITRLGICGTSYQETTDPYYDQAVQLLYNNSAIITFGQVATSIVQDFSIEQSVFFADIHWQKLIDIQYKSPIYKAISKLPSVKRDVSLVIDHAVSFQSIQDLVSSQGDKKIESMQLLDVYQGENLPSNKKAYTIQFALQCTNKTLDEKSIDKIMHHLMHIFECNLNAIIRR